MSNEGRESGWSKGGACSGARSDRPTRDGRSLKDQAKPFCITRMEVLEAYFKVKSNKGAAGIDDETIENFERNLKRNLYKFWNRMSSGTYFPPGVRTVMIPKANGGKRALGIPTVADRVAQMVVKNRVEPMVEPLFHANSFGYRPGKSALDAVGWARQRAKRDYAMLAMLFGGGFRRSELVGLEFDDIQMRQGHWAVVDLIGKGGHIRTVPIPAWVKAALDQWTRAAGVSDGKIFLAVARLGKVWGDGISQNVVWYVVRTCCQRAGLEHIAPQDLRRRTCAKLCHDSGGELEQIQFLLGHASVQTNAISVASKIWDIR